MFQITWAPTGLKGCCGVAEDDALTAFIDDILEERLQVRHTRAYFLGGNMYVLPILLTKMGN